MNFEYSHLLPEHFSPSSRVWVYQSNRLFTLSEALQLEQQINDFVQQWKSHGADVEAFGTLFFGQFVMLIADETSTGVSGCSTDSSVRFVKQLEQQYGVNLFDRNNLAFIVKDKIQLLPLSQLSYAFSNGFVNAETLYFNNTIQTKAELEKNWIVPVKNSWLAHRLNLATT